MNGVRLGATVSVRLMALLAASSLEWVGAAERAPAGIGWQSSFASPHAVETTYRRLGRAIDRCLVVEGFLVRGEVDEAARVGKITVYVAAHGLEVSAQQRFLELSIRAVGSKGSEVRVTETTRHSRVFVRAAPQWVSGEDAPCRRWTRG